MNLTDDNRKKAEEAIRVFLEAMGQDVTSSGLIDTPKRVTKMYEELLTQNEINFTTFNIDHNEMIIVKDIDFTSMCEHHLMPFHGKASIAYYPSMGKVLGLSKLARLVEEHSHKLQTQEEMGTSILNALSKIVGENIIIKLTAEHFCMIARGVKKPGAKTTTIEGRGVFSRESKTNDRLEFLGESHE